MKRREQQLPLPQVEEIQITPAQRAMYFGRFYSKLLRDSRAVVRLERRVKR